jgi:anaerobic ribonucleoside-triphosphate reductase activating protein
MGYLNIASIRPCTESEGPGKRFAIWVQGCERRCPGCCNPEMQEIKKNIIVSTDDLINMIKQPDVLNEIEGLSFIGGEPILQSEGLAEIAEWAHENDLTVLIFTGYLIEELKSLNNDSVNKLLEHTDILVDGPYIQELNDLERDWIGSSNQRVLFLTDAYSSGVEIKKNEHQIEVMISDKDILVNGWPY